MPKKKAEILEIPDVEQPFVDHVENDGNEAIKIFKTGWPDRLVLLEHGHKFFIELKRPGKSPRKLQTYIHSELRKKGHIVYWADNLKEAVEYYEREKLRSKKVSNKSHQIYAEQSCSRVVPSSRSGKNYHYSKGYGVSFKERNNK